MVRFWKRISEVQYGSVRYSSSSVGFLARFAGGAGDTDRRPLECTMVLTPEEGFAGGAGRACRVASRWRGLCSNRPSSSTLATSEMETRLPSLRPAPRNSGAEMIRVSVYSARTVAAVCGLAGPGSHWRVSPSPGQNLSAPSPSGGVIRTWRPDSSRTSRARSLRTNSLRIAKARKWQLEKSSDSSNPIAIVFEPLFRGWACHDSGRRRS